MVKILELLKSEYSHEYSSEYYMKKYTKPCIYPKIVTSKPLSSFSEEEKAAILEKYKRWYIYYSFDHPTLKTGSGTPKKVRQSPIYLNANKDYPNFEDRLKFLKLVMSSVENLLKEGFSPYEDKEASNNHSANTSLDFALKIKQEEVKQTTYSGYKTRIDLFKKYLKNKGYSNYPIKEINKSIVSQYLRTIENATNRNNTKRALSAIFSVLSNEDLIELNFIKEMQNSKKEEKPVLIYKEEDINRITKLLEQHDQTLLMFVKFISFMFWRPIEILRIRVEDVDFLENTISVETKTKASKTKIIPNLLIDDLKEFAKGKNGFLFKPDKVENWDLPEEDKRKNFTKRFFRFREKFDISKDFKLYSFRHTYITKIYLELRKTLSKHDTIQQLSLITGHESKAIYNYIRVNDVELPEDYSSYLK